MLFCVSSLQKEADMGAYTHRFNRNGDTVDSICHDCFRTVGTATREADLEVLEQRHTCSPDDQLRFNPLSEAIKLGPPSN